MQLDKVELRANYFTSFYGNMKNIPDDFLMVSIARFPPKNLFDNPPVNLMEFVDYAPDEDTLKGIKEHRLTRDEYSRRYIHSLMFDLPPKFGVSDFVGFMRYMDEHTMNNLGYHNIVFLCYEKPADFCHRHLLAKLYGLYGVKVEELPLPSDKPRKTYTAPLF